MRRMIRRVLGLALSGSLMLGCTGGAAAQGVFTREMTERSYVSAGNTQRLHRAIDKARAGEKVTIAYIGGSITEGLYAEMRETQCYAALSAQIFADKYMPDAQQLVYVNAGISGTPSLLGVTRCAADVIAKAPDVVFVEFAVNDASDADARMAYESLVRKLLKSESEPAVILLFTILKNGYTAQPHMQKIGAHYDLGMISVGDALTPAFKDGSLTWEDYSPDESHPGTAGHAFVAGLIGHYFDRAQETAPQEYALPDAPVYSAALEPLVNIRKGDPAIAGEGSFPSAAVKCYTYRQGWRHWGDRGAGKEPLSLRVDAAYMTLVFMQQNNKKFGTAEVIIDGALRDTMSGHDEKAWGNPVTRLYELGEGTHTVEIRMAEGEEDRDFILLDIGAAK